MHAAAMNPQEIIRIFRKERVVIDAKAPIGVMDGGLGGFTVVKELQKILPEEDIISVSYTHLDVYKRQVQVPFGKSLIC